MSDPFLGEIRMFAGNFAPQGWALCDGQAMPVSQYSALFSLLGTTYGGNGQTTFCLPDLRSRVPVHAGQGLGLSPYNLGQQSGSEQVTLLITQIPAHNHPIQQGCNNSTQNTSTADPTNAFPSNTDQTQIYAASSNANMGATMSGVAGGSQPHANIQPYLCLNFIIALVGIYPSRN